MRKIIFIFLTIVSSLYSQNIIKNGDFEEFIECPTNLGQVSRCKYLFNPNFFTSPDYFNYNCLGYKVTYNPYKLFEINAQSGYGYIGLGSRTELAYSYQEYVLLELDSILETNKKYKLTFFVKLNKLKYYQNVFDVVFTDKKEFKKRVIKGYSIIDETQVVSIHKKDGYKNYTDWEEVSVEYTGKGNESYILVGLNYKTLRKFSYNNKRKFLLDKNCVDDVCYYFFDNFSLIEVNPSPSPSTEIPR